jgi:hypothetical protein
MPVSPLKRFLSEASDNTVVEWLEKADSRVLKGSQKLIQERVNTISGSLYETAAALLMQRTKKDDREQDGFVEYSKVRIGGAFPTGTAYRSTGFRKNTDGRLTDDDPAADHDDV